MKAQTVPLTKEEFQRLLQESLTTRKLSLSGLKSYAYSLADESAFAISRLLPKDMVAQMCLGVQGDLFVEKILNVHASISKLGPIPEVEAIKKIEDTFLASSLVNDLLSYGK